MATPKGGVSFEADDKRYTMTFSINAMCEIEEELDMGITDIGEIMSAGQVRMKHLRAMFRAGLVDNHPDMTTAQAGDLMTELGPQRAADIIGEAFTAAFPSEKAGPANPPKKRRAGIG
jgi:hypothetical protein